MPVELDNGYQPRRVGRLAVVMGRGQAIGRIDGGDGPPLGFVVLFGSEGSRRENQDQDDNGGGFPAIPGTGIACDQGRCIFGNNRCVWLTNVPQNAV